MLSAGDVAAPSRLARPRWLARLARSCYRLRALGTARDAAADTVVRHVRTPSLLARDVPHPDSSKSALNREEKLSHGARLL
jgi:hypothetical protein